MFLQHTINGILVIIEGLEAACDTGKVNWGMVPYVKHKYTTCKGCDAALSQIMLCAVHACRRAGVGPGKKVAILGAGPIGNCNHTVVLLAH